MKLNWGCGIKKFHLKNWINIDCSAKCEPDVRHDIMVVPWFSGSLSFHAGPNGPIPAILPSNSVIGIRADNLLEHVPLPRNPGEDRLRDILNEAHRVLQPTGEFWIRVPDALAWPWGAFRDPTHTRFWVEGSFDYWDVSKGTWRDYGKSYGYLPWKLRVEKHRNAANGAVFLDATMSPVKGSVR